MMIILKYLIVNNCRKFQINIQGQILDLEVALYTKAQNVKFINRVQIY